MKLSGKARQILAAPESYPLLARMDRRDEYFRIWFYPALADHYLWAVYFWQHDRCRIRRIRWMRAGGFPRPLEPLTSAAEAIIDRDTVEEKFTRLRKVIAAVDRKTFWPAATIIIDGINFGVVYHNSQNTFRYFDESPIWREFRGLADLLDGNCPGPPVWDAALR